MRRRSCTGRRGGRSGTASPRNAIANVARRNSPSDVGVSERRCSTRLAGDRRRRSPRPRRRGRCGGGGATDPRQPRPQPPSRLEIARCYLGLKRLEAGTGTKRITGGHKKDLRDKIRRATRLVRPHARPLRARPGDPRRGAERGGRRQVSLDGRRLGRRIAGRGPAGNRKTDPRRRRTRRRHRRCRPVRPEGGQAWPALAHGASNVRSRPRPHFRCLRRLRGPGHARRPSRSHSVGAGPDRD